MALKMSQEDSRSEALKRHFASRVSTQVRTVLDQWRLLNVGHWEPRILREFTAATDKLVRHAIRFEADVHLQKAKQILELLKQVKESKSQPNSEQLAELNDLVYSLSQSTRRRTDSEKHPDDRIPSTKPVYLASANAAKLATQLEHFGIPHLIIEDSKHFTHIIQRRVPSTIVIDVDFDGPGNGIELIRQRLALKFPVIFTSSRQEASLQERLAACRVGGLRFFTQPNSSQLIRSIEKLRNDMPEQPYKVLVVDDSKSQALYSERIMNQAGMITKAVIDPMEVLNAIEDFQPELIVMDMYMPGCEGTELAMVIRQKPEYLRIPILFLSGEEDREKQLNAMSQGGDDFLTKPVDPKHLIATIHNRGQRARELNNLIVRDSLTGLFNHTHILNSLYQAQRRAKEKHSRLCFAMVDIDFFKKINDNYGHPVGDKVIGSLSLFLKQRLRKTDHIGRYGGEEFAVVLVGTRADDAVYLMDEIREGFGKLEHQSNDSDFKVTFSCGICAFDGENQDHMIEYADAALYEAKKAGRNKVVLYESPTDQTESSDKT